MKDDDTAWCYTVGLVENYDHPELALLDVELDHQSRLITALVQDVVARGELVTAARPRERLRCVEVHPDHLRGDLFGTWANRYGDFPEPGGEMIQILLPTTRTASPTFVPYVGSTGQGPLHQGLFRRCPVRRIAERRRRPR